MGPTQGINWHICCKGGGYWSIRKTGPLVPECSSEADLISASNSSGVVYRNKEHVLAEFRVLLGQKIRRNNT